MVRAGAHAAFSLGPGQGLGPGSHGAEAAPAGGRAPPFSLTPNYRQWGGAQPAADVQGRPGS